MNESQLENGLYPRETKFTLKLSVLNGILIIFFIQAMNGPLFTKFWLQLGVGQTTIGLITALIWGMQVFSPLASTLASFFKSRKVLAAITAVLGYGCVLLTVSIAYVSPNKLNAPIPLMITIFAIACFWLAINNAAWPSLMAEVISPKIQVRYMIWRTGIMTIIGTILSIVASIFLDTQGDTLQNIKTVFLTAIGTALLGAVTLFFHKEPRIPIKKFNVSQAYTVPLRNKNFKRFLFYTLVSSFAITMMIPIQNTYLFNILQMNSTSASGYFAISSVMAFIIGMIISRFIEKIGNKPIIFFTTLAIGILMPLFFILAGPKAPWLVYFAAPCEGLIIGIVTPCIYCLAVKTAPLENRFVYMAMFAGAMGLGGGLGAFISGPLYNLLQPLQFSFLGIDWNSHRLMFLFTGLFRLATLKVLSAVSEENAWTVRKTAKYILATIFRRKKLDMDE